MLIIPNQTRGRKRRSGNAVPIPVLSPTLVAANFDPDNGLGLTFDRAIDASAFVAGQLVIHDAGTQTRYVPTGEIYSVGDDDLLMLVTPDGPFAGTGQTLTAGPANGIVAVDGGAMWAGVTDLALPFF